MSAWTTASALSIAAAAWVARPDGRWVLRRRLRWQTGRATATLGPAALAAGTFAALWLVPASAARFAVLMCAAAAWFCLRLHRGSRERAAATEFSGEVARVVRTLASELRAGVPPIDGLRAALEDGSDVWQPLRAVEERDVPESLRLLADRPGGSGLLEAAAAWDLADKTGAPLSGFLGRVADGIRGRLELEREVALEAAPARATGRLMALLPALGLGLGTMLGAHPVRVLVATWPGVVCLGVGVSLSCAGLWWIDRIVKAAERQ